MNEYASKRTMPFSRWLLAGFAVLVVISLAFAWRFLNTDKQAPDSLLTKEERRQMDIVLFNELRDRNSGKLETLQKRYEKLKALADRGFEAAEFAIVLYDLKPALTWRDRFFDWFTYWRLRWAARKGDPSLLCLVARVISDFRIKSDKTLRFTYARRAYEAGQANCTLIVSGYYRSGNGPVPPDFATAEDLVHKAARRGDASAQMTIASAYAEGTYGLTIDFGKSRCWMELARRSGTDGARYSNYAKWAISVAREQGVVDDFPIYDPDSNCEIAIDG